MQFLKHDPEKFYALVRIIEAAPRGSSKELSEMVRGTAASLAEDLESLTEAVNAMNEEARQSLASESRFKPIQEMAEDQERASPSASGFLWVCHRVVREIGGLFNVLGGMTEAINPPALRVFKIEERDLFTYEGMQRLNLMVDMNGPAMEKYFGNVLAAEGAQRHVVQCVKALSDAMEPFYRVLVKRHTEDGLEVTRTPVLTDVALTIYKNIDMNGEMEGGTDASRISAYTVRKGQIVARAVQDEPMGSFVRASVLEGGDIQSYVREHIDKAWSVATRLAEATRAVTPSIKEHLQPAKPGRAARYRLSRHSSLAIGRSRERQHGLLSRDQVGHFDHVADGPDTRV